MTAAMDALAIPVIWFSMGLICMWIFVRQMELEEDLTVGMLFGFLFFGALILIPVLAEMLCTIKLPKIKPRLPKEKPSYLAEAEIEVDRWLQ